MLAPWPGSFRYVHLTSWPARPMDVSAPVGFGNPAPPANEKAGLDAIFSARASAHGVSSSDRAGRGLAVRDDAGAAGHRRIVRRRRTHERPGRVTRALGTGAWIPAPENYPRSDL